MSEVAATATRVRALQRYRVEHPRDVHLIATSYLADYPLLLSLEVPR